MFSFDYFFGFLSVVVVFILKMLIYLIHMEKLVVVEALFLMPIV